MNVNSMSEGAQATNDFLTWLFDLSLAVVAGTIGGTAGFGGREYSSKSSLRSFTGFWACSSC